MSDKPVEPKVYGVHLPGKVLVVQMWVNSSWIGCDKDTMGQLLDAALFPGGWTYSDDKGFTYPGHRITAEDQIVFPDGWHKSLYSVGGSDIGGTWDRTRFPFLVQVDGFGWHWQIKKPIVQSDPGKQGFCWLEGVVTKDDAGHYDYTLYLCDYPDRPRIEEIYTPDNPVYIQKV